MRNDIKELERKALELAREVGPKARYRLLEIHERLKLMQAAEEASEKTPTSVPKAA